MDCCFEGASDSKIAFPKSMSIGVVHIVYLFKNNVVTLYISVGKPLRVQMFYSFIQFLYIMFPAEHCERDMNLLSRAWHKVQEKIYCKDAKNITQGSQGHPTTIFGKLSVRKTI